MIISKHLFTFMKWLPQSLIKGLLQSLIRIVSYKLPQSLIKKVSLRNFLKISLSQCLKSLIKVTRELQDAHPLNKTSKVSLRTHHFCQVSLSLKSLKVSF